jgi:penicillin amidase
VTAERLEDRVTIRRDSYGIPHVSAQRELDAWLGMGFACAGDRLFQMDYDRRRATGRWAEVAGEGALPADILARRLRLADAAKADLEVMSARLRAAFEAYAEGVNRAIRRGPLPMEAVVLGYEIEPWEPWHSLAAFKVRHVLMGPWQHKLAQAIVLARSGGEALRRLDTRDPKGAALTVPSGGRLEALMTEAVEEIAAVEPYLDFLAEVEPGSNAWAVAASHTAHGAAVLCNDSHRALDTPNVYWQCQVSCPDFDVIGGTFPGLPGFPHFGHNGRVAWAITHAMADNQDLYLEWFDAEVPGRYRTPAGWAEAECREEVVSVRGAAPVTIEAWRTMHGPVVHGDPRAGMALSLRYTGTDRPRAGLEAMPAMLAAGDVTELVDAQRDWVDPVNNLLAADTGGRIAYQTRGLLPVRSSAVNRRLPVPGWTGEGEWLSTVAFEYMPRMVDPEAGYVLTANNVIVEGDEPYVSYGCSEPFRAERIRQHLARPGKRTASELAGLQGDVSSWAASAWTAKMAALPGPLSDSRAEAARTMLSAWDGRLGADSAEALVYGCFRRVLAEHLYRPVVGSATWEWMVSDDLPATGTLIRRALGRDVWHLLGGPTGGDDARTPEEPERGSDVDLAAVLAEAWEDACAMGGPDPAAWRWSDHHRLTPVHPLASLEAPWPVAIQAEPVGMGGDGDTVQAASYGWRRRAPFNVAGLSVYRQAVDLGDPGSASWVIPGGSSGDPSSVHFADQLPLWARHERARMALRPDDLQEDCEHETGEWPTSYEGGRPEPALKPEFGG